MLISLLLERGNGIAKNNSKVYIVVALRYSMNIQEENLFMANVNDKAYIEAPWGLKKDGTPKKAPFFARLTKEEAKVYQKRGGLARKAAIFEKRRITGIKHGMYSKNQFIKDLIKPTEVERYMGITTERKIEIIKAVAPAMNAGSIQEFIDEYAKTLIDIKIKLFAAEKELEEQGIPKYKIIPLLMQYADRELKFGEMKWKMNKPTTNINNTVTFDMGRLKEAWNKVNKENKEIKEREISERINSDL